MKNKEKKFLVQVDKYGEWSYGKYREVSEEELDELVNKYGTKVLSMCGNGSSGSMIMWAYFKNKINGGNYSDIVNAYELLSYDPKSLVDREHEFRHALDKYTELWQIRYYGSVADYYMHKAKEAHKHFDESESNIV